MGGMTSATSAGWIRTTACVLGVFVLAVGGTGCAVETSSGRDDDRSEPGGHVDVAVVDSLQRLQPRTRIADLAPTKAIVLESARGEREAAQLVVSARDGAPRLVLHATRLTGPGGATIPARNVRPWLEQVLTVQRGSPAGRSGEYTDPLVPAPRRDVVLAPDERLVAWIDVETPVDAKPGIYTGSVELRAATRRGEYATGRDGLLARVPVQLTVRAATLPDRPSLGSSVGVDASQIVRFEGVAAGSSELRTAIDSYARVLADARLSIADVGIFPPGTNANQAASDGPDAAFLRGIFERRGVANVRIPFYMDSPFADPLGVDRPAALAYLRAAARWARSNGWMDRAYVYAIDEPDASRAGEVRELRALLREADPGLRLLLTRERTAREFAGNVDIWTPNISATRFRAADVTAARRAGQSTWWYPSVTTWQPQPALFVDELRPAPRALGWLAWRYGVEGMLYWSATHWHEVKDPYRDSATYRETDAVGNGDGVLLYPGKPVGRAGTPSPSVRLFQLRDGVDDHDLFTLAACHGTQGEAARMRAAVARLAPSMTDFDATPVLVARTRRLAFDILDAAATAGRWDPSSRDDACA